jgi:hypothetical protein
MNTWAGERRSLSQGKRGGAWEDSACQLRLVVGGCKKLTIKEVVATLSYFSEPLNNKCKNSSSNGGSKRTNNLPLV